MLKTLFAAIGILVVVVGVVGYVAITWGSNLNWLFSYFNRPAYERWTSQFDYHGVAPGDVVMLGDSLTEWTHWHEWFPQQPIRNRGIAGDDTRGVLNRLDSIVAGKPHSVFLMIGTNDLMGGVEPATVLDNIHRIIERIQSDSPDTRILVQSLLPRRPAYTPKVYDLNQQLAASLAEHQPTVIWIDMYKDFLAASGDRIDPAYSNDQLHLNASGYAVWSQKIAPWMPRATDLGNQPPATSGSQSLVESIK